MVLFKKTTAKTCLAQYSVYLSTVYIANYRKRVPTYESARRNLIGLIKITTISIPRGIYNNVYCSVASQKCSARIVLSRVSNVR